MKRGNKKAVSVVVGYVLLISITLSLSVLVYGWLRWQFNPENEFKECPEGVNIVIYEVLCYQDTLLNITLKNKGLFSVDGYYLRYNNKSDSEFGIYNLDQQNLTKFSPGEERNETFTDAMDGSGEITLIEVQPYQMDGSGKISCKSKTTQRVTCIPNPQTQ